MFNKDIITAKYQTKELQGGTLGDVQLVTGMAETVNGDMLPYKIVLKTQKKWVRPGDSISWRREYDLYRDDFKKVFSNSFRWPYCYYAEVNGDVINIWMEYIDGISGCDLTIDNLEIVAEELGCFQGRVYKNPEFLKDITYLGDIEYVKRDYEQWHKQTYSYEFLISESCRIPGFLKQMLIDKRIQYNTKTIEYNYLRSVDCKIPEHLKKMFIDIDDNMKIVFSDIKKLPIVLCHRDFWIENIFLSRGKVILIDWDCAGLGFIGEDIASLIIDEVDIDCIEEYYQRLVPAYYKGISKYMDISKIEYFFIQEMIIIKFGYRILQKYMFTQSLDVKNEQITVLQKIYEMRNKYTNK